MISADFLIEDADLVATCAGAAPRAGAAQGDIAALPRASVASLDGQIVFVGTGAGRPARAVAEAGCHGRLRARAHGDSRLRRCAYPPGVRGRSSRRAAAPAGGRHLRRDRRLRRRHRQDGGGHARGRRERPGRGGAPAPGGDAGARHHHRRGEERLWARPRFRAEDAARHQAARRRAAGVADRHLHGRARVPGGVPRRPGPLRGPGDQHDGAGRGRRGAGRVV